MVGEKPVHRFNDSELMSDVDQSTLLELDRDAGGIVGSYGDNPEPWD